MFLFIRQVLAPESRTLWIDNPCMDKGITKLSPSDKQMVTMLGSLIPLDYFVRIPHLATMPGLLPACVSHQSFLHILWQCFGITCILTQLVPQRKSFPLFHR